MAHQYKLRKVNQFPELFFHPIVCHICKRLNNGNTIPCDCGMISYCCQDHTTLDEDHKVICEIIQTYKKLVTNRRIRENCAETLNQFNKFKMKRLNIIQKRLARVSYKMRQCDEDMLMFSRSCFVCYTETNLRPCQECFSVDYCKTHYKKNVPHECDKLQEWLYSEIRALDTHPFPKYCRLPFHEFPSKDVNNMHSFYQAYILLPNASWTILDTIYSDYISGPLTFYYGMCNAMIPITPRYTENVYEYVIHVIEAQMHVDWQVLMSWEIFLHTFKQKKIKLKVIMIGSKLTSEVNINKDSVEGKLDFDKLCWEKCMAFGHELHFEWYCRSYEKYVMSESYIKPDAIIEFHVQLKKTNVPKNLLKFKTHVTLLKRQACPIILTTKSRKSAVDVVKNIEIISEGAKPLVNKINKFKGCRPHRYDLNVNIYYRNQRVIVYQNLDP